MSSVPVLYADFFLGPQDLKKKYNAKWALVTGASSGIGRALAEKMAQQVSSDHAIFFFFFCIQYDNRGGKSEHIINQFAPGTECGACCTGR